MAAIGAQASGGSKEQGRSANRAGNVLSQNSQQLIQGGAKTRDLLFGLTEQALENPAEAAKRLNPFSVFASDVVGRSIGQSRSRLGEIIGSQGLTGPFAARLRADQSIQGALAQAQARLAPVQGLIQQAPGISEIGLAPGVGGLSSFAGQQANLTATAAEREKNQDLVGVILGALL